MPKSTDGRNVFKTAGKPLIVSVGEPRPQESIKSTEEYIQSMEGVSRRRETWITIIILLLACTVGAAGLFRSDRQAEALSVLSSTIAAVVSVIALIFANRSAQITSRLEHQITRKRLEAERLRTYENETAILIRALEVFGDGERALQWMRESNAALNGEPPIRVIQTEVGRSEVLNVLGRIQHGVIS